MRKNLFLSATILLFGLALNSCSKVAQQIAQSIGWTGIDVTISVPPSTTVDTGSYATVGTGTFTYNLDSFVKANTGGTLGLKNVDQFKFKSCTLTILNPDAANNFANFKQAKASFYTSNNTVPTLLGEITDNPNTYASTLTLPVNTTTNLRPYLPTTGPVTIMYDISGALRAVRTVTLQVQVHIEYDIHVTP